MAALTPSCLHRRPLRLFVFISFVGMAELQKEYTECSFYKHYKAIKSNYCGLIGKRKRILSNTRGENKIGLKNKSLSLLRMLVPFSVPSFVTFFFNLQLPLSFNFTLHFVLTKCCTTTVTSVLLQQCGSPIVWQLLFFFVWGDFPSWLIAVDSDHLCTGGQTDSWLRSGGSLGHFPPSQSWCDGTLFLKA